MRKRDIEGFYSESNDIVEFMKAYPDVGFRYYIKPEVPLMPEYEILEFDFLHTQPVME